MPAGQKTESLVIRFLGAEIPNFSDTDGKTSIDHGRAVGRKGSRATGSGIGEYRVWGHPRRLELEIVEGYHCCC
jgi:hypothetical protein